MLFSSPLFLRKSLVIYMTAHFLLSFASPLVPKIPLNGFLDFCQKLVCGTRGGEDNGGRGGTYLGWDGCGCLEGAAVTGNLIALDIAWLNETTNDDIWLWDLGLLVGDWQTLGQGILGMAPGADVNNVDQGVAVVGWTVLRVAISSEVAWLNPIDEVSAFLLLDGIVEAHCCGAASAMSCRVQCRADYNVVSNAMPCLVEGLFWEITGVNCVRCSA